MEEIFDKRVIFESMYLEKSGVCPRQTYINSKKLLASRDVVLYLDLLGNKAGFTVPSCMRVGRDSDNEGSLNIWARAVLRSRLKAECDGGVCQ